MAKVAGMLEWKSEVSTNADSVRQRDCERCIHSPCLTLDSLLNRQWEEGVVDEVSISEQAMDLP